MDKELEKNISKAVISRLPRYYRYLNELQEQGIDHISSKELSEIMKVTASQIRQDLNNFGGFGQQGYGYNVRKLYEEIGHILGVEDYHNLILIGVGNLGRALVNYKGFKSHGFRFCGLFDLNEALSNETIKGIRIRSMKELESFINNAKVDIAVITTPRDAAKATAKDIYDYGVRYFWNFSNTDLALPDDAIIKNVHLLDSLLELSYSISSK